jgi:CBS-domain-containing membrane protein
VTPDAVTRTLLEEAAVTIGDIMTTTVVSIAPETPYPEIVERLLESGVSGVPVLDGSSRLVGIVTRIAAGCSRSSSTRWRHPGGWTRRSVRWRPT